MSRDWTEEELKEVSKAMKAAGHMSFEEFSEELEKKGFSVVASATSPDRLQPGLQDFNE